MILKDDHPKRAIPAGHGLNLAQWFQKRSFSYDILSKSV